MSKNGKTILFPYQKEGVRLIEKFNGRVLLGDEMGLGKQQPVSEPVLTPQGWRPIGDIRPGDYVIGANGSPTKVLGIFPQTDHRVFRVTFSDGSWTRCGMDHLWTVQTTTDRFVGRAPRVLSTEAILKAGLHDKNKNRKWHIPMTRPVQSTPADLPVHPYILGVLLGDGSLATPKHSTRFTPGDDQVPAVVASLLPAGIRNRGRHRINLMREAMVALGLDGIDSAARHIPPAYLMASPEQRLDLICGLLDTDGEFTQEGVYFSSCSMRMRDQLAELVTSLVG